MSSKADNLPDTKLEGIPRNIFPESLQKIYKVKCLSINGRSPSLTALMNWAIKENADFKKIVKVLTMVCSSKEPLRSKKHVKVGKKNNQKEIYEARADKGKARLFFFYVQPDEIIICTNGYWKTDASTVKQNRAFELAASMKELYYKSEVQNAQ